MRLLSGLDIVTRKVPLIHASTALRAGRAVRALDRLTPDRDVPEALVLDNGPELAGQAPDQ